MSTLPLYVRLSQTLTALRNCEKSGNTEWAERHAERITELMRNAPQGSGFDNGTQIDLDRSGEDKLVFTTGFHHMNDTGYYTGWTEHTVTVTPSFGDFNLKVSGQNKNEIKEYIEQCFDAFLKTPSAAVFDADKK